jgi:hypothetical protein
MSQKGFQAIFLTCLKDKKIKNTLAYESSLQRKKEIPAMLFFNFRLLIILSSFIYKTLQIAKQEIYIYLQNSSRMFNFISKNLKKGENTRGKSGKV